MSGDQQGGGPAFPVMVPFKKDAEGMTLLDWFAGQAIQGCMRDAKQLPVPAYLARYAYEFADAMLVERERRRV